MSYSISLCVDTGGPDPASIGELDWNYTSNVACMWRAAMPESDGLAGFQDKPAGECADILERGIAKMRDNHQMYVAMNPSNGWGSFDGQLKALGELLIAFRKHPKATVRVWR